MTNLRIGHGYDVHRLTAGRPLILGGVHVPYDRGLDGHSDADVLTHAVMDALLGAAALGDPRFEQAAYVAFSAAYASGYADFNFPPEHLLSKTPLPGGKSLCVRLPAVQSSGGGHISR